MYVCIGVRSVTSQATMLSIEEEPVPDLYKSILSQLLKEALGGNCKTLLICHVPDEPLDHAGVYEAVAKGCFESTIDPEQSQQT